jgi:hypothetical protein
MIQHKIENNCSGNTHVKMVGLYGPQGQVLLISNKWSRKTCLGKIDGQGMTGELEVKWCSYPMGGCIFYPYSNVYIRGDKNSENLLPFRLNIWYVLEQVRSREYSRVGVQTSVVAALVMLNSISFVKKFKKHCG